MATKKGQAKTINTPQLEEAQGQLTRCPKCDSTRRGPYLSRDVQEFAGLDPVSGQPYSSIVRRRTACGDCGQHRIDRHLVFEPGEDAA